MSKNYKISEERLKELLEIEAHYNALLSGGVDNWEWAGASESDFLDEYRNEPEMARHLKDLEDEGVCTDDFWFDDIAEFGLKNYSII